MAEFAEVYNLPDQKLHGATARKCVVEWMHDYAEGADPTIPSPREKTIPLAR
jgi:hypothetical protein